jgi:hypothetical protein
MPRGASLRGQVEERSFMGRKVQYCAKGLHAMTRDNTYEHPSKGAECRECKRTYMRAYMREVRQSAARTRQRAK